jgi:hypothetical protein
MPKEQKGKLHTNFHSNRALEVNPHPWAKRVPDPTLGRALGLGIATRSDFRVYSADRDAQTRRFEGSLALARLLAEMVSTHPNLVSHNLTEEQLYAHPE